MHNEDIITMSSRQTPSFKHLDLKSSACKTLATGPSSMYNIKTEKLLGFARDTALFEDLATAQRELTNVRMSCFSKPCRDLSPPSVKVSKSSSRVLTPGVVKHSPRMVESEEQKPLPSVSLPPPFIPLSLVEPNLPTFVPLITEMSRGVGGYDPDFGLSRTPAFRASFAPTLPRLLTRSNASIKLESYDSQAAALVASQSTEEFFERFCRVLIHHCKPPVDDNINRGNRLKRLVIPRCPDFMEDLVILVGSVFESDDPLYPICRKLESVLSLSRSLFEQTPETERLTSIERASDWLTKELERNESERPSPSYCEAYPIFSCLVKGDVLKAADTAISRGYPHLASLVIQLYDSKDYAHIQRLISQIFTQTEQWSDEYLASLPDDVAKCYLLLSGVPNMVLSYADPSSPGGEATKTIQICADLPWMACLALHTWYLAGQSPNNTLADVLRLYTGTSQSGMDACAAPCTYIGEAVDVRFSLFQCLACISPVEDCFDSASYGTGSHLHALGPVITWLALQSLSPEALFEDVEAILLPLEQFFNQLVSFSDACPAAAELCLLLASLSRNVCDTNNRLCDFAVDNFFSKVVRKQADFPDIDLDQNHIFNAVRDHQTSIDSFMLSLAQDQFSSSKTHPPATRLKLCKVIFDCYFNTERYSAAHSFFWENIVPQTLPIVTTSEDSRSSHDSALIALSTSCIEALTPYHSHIESRSWETKGCLFSVFCATVTLYDEVIRRHRTSLALRDVDKLVQDDFEMETGSKNDEEDNNNFEAKRTELFSRVDDLATFMCQNGLLFDDSDIKLSPQHTHILLLVEEMAQTVAGCRAFYNRKPQDICSELNFGFDSLQEHAENRTNEVTMDSSKMQIDDFSNVF